MKHLTAVFIIFAAMLAAYAFGTYFLLSNVAEIIAGR